jgi:hypothetical protein
VHDDGAAAEVSAEPHAVGVGDAHPAGDDVVGHPRELVEPEDLHGPSRGARCQPYLLEVVDRTGPEVGPDDVVEQPEHVVEVGAIGGHEAVGQQVQAQIDIVRVDGRVIERLDERRHRPSLDPTERVVPAGAGHVNAQQLTGRLRVEPHRPGGVRAEAGCLRARIRGG